MLAALDETFPARSNIIDRMEELGAIAHAVVRYPTGRKGLETARKRCLEAIVPNLVHEGTEHLVIESRGAVEDARDRSVLIDALKDVEPSESFSYGFDGKARRVLWMPDAVCGAIREHLINAANAPYYDRLREAGILPAQLVYVGA